MEFREAIEKIIGFTYIGESLTILLSIVAILILRRTYKKYASKRLFFSPWINMTNVKELNLGLSLSEMLFFELESIQEVHKKSATYRGLWNEKNQIPVFEQSSDGEPNLLGRVKFLEASGLLGFFLKVAQFIIFFPTPMVLKGSIHKYGNLIRLQVTIEGLRNDKKRLIRSQCWKKEDTNGDISNIPEMISELAYSIYMTLADSSGCKTTESFRYLTSGFLNHLKYDHVLEEDVALNAIDFYKKAINADGGKNALASYNLALIYYSRYTGLDNDMAIKHYQEALHTTNHVLRAQAYCGLANCYCQKVQRHNSGNESTLMDAIRFANFGYQIQKGKGIATIAKALAYTWQVIYERNRTIEGVSPESISESKDKAIKFYLEAIECNKDYTIAYNNLGHFYLFLAKGEESKKTRIKYLDEAKKNCLKAIDTDPTYHHAYDNLGNIYVLKEEYITAEKQYYNALDYAPEYFAAHDDLSKLYLKLSKMEVENNVSPETYHEKAIESHFNAIHSIKGKEEEIKSACSSFKSAFIDFDLDIVENDILLEKSKSLKCNCF